MATSLLQGASQDQHSSSHIYVVSCIVALLTTGDRRWAGFLEVALLAPKNGSSRVPLGETRVDCENFDLPGPP